MKIAKDNTEPIIAKTTYLGPHRYYWKFKRA